MKFAIFLLAVFVAVVADRPKSACEKHRESVARTGGILKLMPRCKENGDYEELQCFKGSPFCVCYDKEGHPASPISKNIKECGCFLQQKKMKDELRYHDSVYVPQCEFDGKWVKKQCWDFLGCWCVNDYGGMRGEIVSRNSQLNCDE